jgi:SH3-like domain-containing protein
MRGAGRSRRICAAAALFLAVGAACATDFRSTTEAATITYDAPSTRAKRVSILGRDYPVEVIVNLDAWAKVRDPTGALSWVEKKSLTDRRTVVVRAGMADVFATADSNGAPVFKAEQGVLLDLLDPVPVNGMVNVRHRDGQAGYVRIAQVWGL